MYVRLSACQTCHTEVSIGPRRTSLRPNGSLRYPSGDSQADAGLGLMGGASRAPVTLGIAAVELPAGWHGGRCEPRPTILGERSTTLRISLLTGRNALTTPDTTLAIKSRGPQTQVGESSIYTQLPGRRGGKCIEAGKMALGVGTKSLQVERDCASCSPTHWLPSSMFKVS